MRIAIWLLCVVLAVFGVLLVSCGPVKLTLARAHLSPNGPAASPALNPERLTLPQWEDTLAPRIRQDLQSHIYGYFPQSPRTEIIERRTLGPVLGGTGHAQELTLRAFARYGNSENQTRPFKMVVVRPAAAPDAPMILMQTFCPNHNTVPIAGVSRPDGFDMDCSGEGIIGGIMSYVFGRYIATPPLEMILERGYGLATIFPSEYIPDKKSEGEAALADFTKGHVDRQTRLGAIGAWAWGYSRMADALSQGQSESQFIVYGHSRYGKAALIAAAYDQRLDGVISHQSGTGGAALSKDKRGETVGEITKAYPHWFAPHYADYAGREQELPIDQHAVLALIAPRPIFLGNARRDVWSDPNSSFRAAQGVDRIYKLYGKQGLQQTNLKPFVPSADISFFLRPGTHGVVKEDWPAFLDFLDAHFKTNPK